MVVKFVGNLMSSITVNEINMKADAYLNWAIQTKFSYFRDVTSDPVMNIGLIVKWNNVLGEGIFRAINRIGKIAKIYQQELIVTVTLPLNNLNQFLTAYVIYIDRIELSSPLSSYSAPIANLNFSLMSGNIDAVANNAPPVVLGCIDAGFPIASKRYLDSVKNKTRIVRFWNQDINIQTRGKKLNTLSKDPVGTDFDYGRELIPFLPGSQQPNETNIKWLLPDLNLISFDTNYYLRSRLTMSLRRMTHGSHVLDLFAGTVDPCSRISTSRNFENGEDGSSTKPPIRTISNSQNALNAPIVLVQLPKYAVDDPSGRWLGRNVLDGLHYIVQTAKTLEKGGSKVSNIVVNLSWGPQTGPHDRSSLLEQAIDAMIEKLRSTQRDLDVILPIGNSREARAHAKFRLEPTTSDLLWSIPPDGQTPSFAEVWWPIGTDIANIEIELTAPNGVICSSKPNKIVANVINKKAISTITLMYQGANLIGLIALAPTYSKDKASPISPHGIWKIKCKSSAPIADPIHVYIARSDHNMGASRKAKSSYFRDPIYEAVRKYKSDENVNEIPNSKVQKYGTLSGICTGQHTRIASGVRFSENVPVRYSSLGPFRNGIKYSYSYPTDVSRMVKGWPAGGTRDVTVGRLIGTSAASPQLARDISNLVVP
jgi:hypothetical protein